LRRKRNGRSGDDLIDDLFKLTTVVHPPISAARDAPQRRSLALGFTFRTVTWVTRPLRQDCEKFGQTWLAQSSLTGLTGG